MTDTCNNRVGFTTASTRCYIERIFLAIFLDKPSVIENCYGNFRSVMHLVSVYLQPLQLWHKYTYKIPGTSALHWWIKQLKKWVNSF